MRQMHDSSVSVVDFARSFEIEDDYESKRFKAHLSRDERTGFGQGKEGWTDKLRNPSERKDSQRRGGAATRAMRNRAAGKLLKRAS